ncbi:glycine--tRNA ligase subunit beta [Anaerobacillus sp. MEB173]|uniref:glycine--tRNA ligase subunit beta n=1 Tax=Anaerobacillus sp. MEB173 TaxID=3383345 RepID=UPI003F933902
MSKRDFLLEIGLEEMPARFVTDAMNQLTEKIADWLTNERVKFGELEAFSTPRRLAVLIHDVAEQQEDMEEEARGPAKKIAKDDEGNWSKAALGFARGQGVEPGDLFFKEVKGVEYVFAKKFTEGKETVNLLPKIEEIIKGMSFPKNMRWNAYDLRFVRPIQWLVIMFGNDVVPVEITNVRSGQQSIGHRFLGSEIDIEAPGSYVEALKEQYVIVDPNERKQLIRQQLMTIESEQGWTIPVDEALLEEVNNLVEYPTALFGGFDESYLSLPKEVLITSMREHQRYFPVTNKDGELLPYFVTVRNGNDSHLENIAKGNEKVLRARLADAQFFHKEDQKMKIEDALAKLENIVYHESLGSIGDKVRRIRDHAKAIAEVLQFSQSEKGQVDRAAELSKFDLVTQMVYEFPELQGLMGEEYAIIAGEEAAVAKAINEHYMPRFSGDRSPESNIGAAVSIADKLDTLVTCFGIGLIPTGSQDPYALRRQAAGIIQIILDKGWTVEFDNLLEIAIDNVEKRQLLKKDKGEVLANLLEFFKLRIKNTLQERNVRYDAIDAVLSSNIKRIDVAVKKAEFLMEQLNEAEFKDTVEALSRVTNIAKKADEKEIVIEEQLFQADEEVKLFAAYKEVELIVTEALAEGDVVRAFAALSSLRDEINRYFDKIMVMSEDEKIKKNRLSQMKQLSDVITSFAHFNSIVFA